MTLLNVKPKRISRWQARYNKEMQGRKTLFAKFFLVSMIVGMVASAILQTIAYGN